MLTVPVTFPPEDVAERRAALRPAAARHPRHDGDVLLLRDRSEPLRRGQHRDRRHPQAPGVRRRRRADRARRPAEPDRQAAARGDPRAKGADAERRRRDEARRARGARGRARCRSRSTGTAPAKIGDGRASTDRSIRLEPGTVEQVDRPRLQHQPAGARPRHGAAASDRRRQRAAALHLAGQLEAGQPAGADVVAGVVRRPTSTSGSAPTARSAGRKRRGRSTRTASTRRRSWTTSIARSTTARR